MTKRRMTKWAKEYGGIFSLKRFMNNTLVITDGQLVRDLVDKKSNIYSHRPVSLVAHLITHDSHLLVMQYGERWRHIRKLIHQYFMESNCEKKHWKVQEAEAIQMLHDFLEAPQNHMMHPKRYSNSIICSLCNLQPSAHQSDLAWLTFTSSVWFPNQVPRKRIHESTLYHYGKMVAGLRGRRNSTGGFFPSS